MALAAFQIHQSEFLVQSRVGVACVSPTPHLVLLAQPLTQPLSRVLSHTPIGRFEKPEDVNGLIVFLVSDDAAFINGAAINIGGGISMH